MGVVNEPIEDRVGECLVSACAETRVNFCNEARFTPSVRFQASSTYGVIDLVSAGFGIAIVPASAATFHTSSVTFRRLINRNLPDARR